MMVAPSVHDVLMVVDEVVVGEVVVDEVVVDEVPVVACVVEVVGRTMSYKCLIEIVQLEGTIAN